MQGRCIIDAEYKTFFKAYVCMVFDFYLNFNLETFRLIFGSPTWYSIRINLMIVRAVHPVFFISFLMADSTISPVFTFEVNAPTRTILFPQLQALVN